jgi:hypothetical protein
MAAAPSKLWAISAYFNPLGYRSRGKNYRIFRERLGVPLITVELAIDGRFELGSDDAEHLLQIAGGSLLWQKERLLTLALRELPDECEFVAWLDADIVFERSSWWEEACAALEEAALVQPFAHVLNVPRGSHPILQSPEAALSTRPSFALNRVSSGGWDFDGKNAALHSYSPGQAWIAHRDLLEQFGFYDRAVIGGADGLMAWAAEGLSEQVAQARGMTAAQKDHYLSWASGWEKAVDRRIAWTEGSVYHLWHGDTQNRRYRERHRILEDHTYDPLNDIAEHPSGSWRWDSSKPQFHADVLEYFRTRNEDGVGEATGSRPL